MTDAFKSKNNRSWDVYLKGGWSDVNMLCG